MDNQQTNQDDSRDNEGLVTFLQALAITIVGIDNEPNIVSSSENFLHVLDGMLGEIQSMTQREGAAEIHESVQKLRGNLDTALRQARNAKYGHERRN